MKALMKSIIIILIILGITLTVMNIFAIDIMAYPPNPNASADKVKTGTLDSDGECTGAPLNC